MEAAAEWGVPHSVLTGRPTRAGEPLFTQQDTALAIALVRLKARTCTGCGNDRAETLEHEYGWRVRPLRCHACAARERAAQAFRDSGGNTAGLLFTVTRQESDDG